MKPKKIRINLSKLRALSDSEWLSTTPGMSGPLWVWRCLPVWFLVLACAASFSINDGGSSDFESLFLRSVFPLTSYSVISFSDIFPLSVWLSTTDTSLPFVFSLETEGDTAQNLFRLGKEHRKMHVHHVLKACLKTENSNQLKGWCI